MSFFKGSLANFTLLIYARRSFTLDTYDLYLVNLLYLGCHLRTMLIHTLADDTILVILNRTRTVILAFSIKDLVSLDLDWDSVLIK